MFNMFVSIFTSLMLVGAIYAVVQINNNLSNEIKISAKHAYGDKGFEVLIGCIMLMWVVPYGVIFVIPGALLLSVLSPAGRKSWRD